MIARMMKDKMGLSLIVTIWTNTVIDHDLIAAILMLSYFTINYLSVFAMEMLFLWSGFQLFMLQIIVTCFFCIIDFQANNFKSHHISWLLH